MAEGDDKDGADGRDGRDRDESADASRAFIPCPACNVPIELPVGELPKRLPCPACGTVLER